MVRSVIRTRAMRRNVSPAYLRSAPVLCKSGKREDQAYGKKSHEIFHVDLQKLRRLDASGKTHRSMSGGPTKLRCAGYQ